jgi:hypothetical protein
MDPLNLEHIRLVSGRVSRSIELTMDLRFNGCLRLGGILQGQASALTASVLGPARLNMGLHDDVSLKPPPASGEPEAYCDRVLQRFERLLFFFAPLRILSVMKV